MRARTGLLGLTLSLAIASAGVAGAAPAPRAPAPHLAPTTVARPLARPAVAPRGQPAPAPKAALAPVLAPEAPRPAVAQMARTVADATRLVSRLPRSVAAPPTAPLRVEVLMRLPVEDVDILDTIDRFGIQPQYVTASTRGMTNAGARYYTERNGINDHAERLPVDVLPRYGYLNVIGRPGTLSETPLRQYGNVIFAFKEDAIGDRTTLHVGDSLFNKTPFMPLADRAALASKLEQNPTFFEAQIWGGLNLDHVASVLLDKEVPRAAITRLKALADKYGFTIYKTKDAPQFNQSLPLARELFYQPRGPRAAGPAFVPLEEGEVLSRLGSAKETELPFLLWQLRNVGGERHADRVAGYLRHDSDGARRAARAILADLGDKRALRAMRDESVDLRERSFLRSRLAPEAVTDVRGAGFSVDVLAEADATLAFAQLDPRVAGDAALLARFARAKNPAARVGVASRLLGGAARGSLGALDGVLAELARDPDVTVASFVAAHLEGLPPASAAPLVEASLAHGDAAVRAALAETLSKSPLPGGPAALDRLATDDDPTVSLAAAKALAPKLAALTPAEAERRARAPELGTRVQGAAAMALGGETEPFLDARLVKIIRGVALDHERSALISAAWVGLSHRKGKIDPKLLDLVFGEGTAERPELFTHLVEGETDANDPWIRKQLTSLAQGDDSVDYYATSPVRLARALGRFAARSGSVPLLEKMATAGTSTEIPSRWLAIQTLGLMKTDAARAALLRLAKSPVEEARLGAESALAAP